MRVNFPQCLKAVLKHEGGYVNHPDDPGGATNRGVTQRTYSAWRKRQGLTYRSVRNITADEVKAIYRAQYWDMIQGDRLPDGLDYAVFDFAVNSGVNRATRFLQKIVGAKVDGILGMETLSAVSQKDANFLINELCDRRMAFLKRLRHWKTFGKGWTRRVAEVRRLACMMDEEGSVPELDLPPVEVAAGKAEGKIKKTALLDDMLKDPKAVGSAVVAAAPGITQLTEGDGPVQWGIGLCLVVGALAVAFYLYQKGREEE